MRDKILQAAIDRLKVSLIDPKSPYSSAAIVKAQMASFNLNTLKNNFYEDKFWKSIATVAIVCAAIGLACVGGMAMGAIAGKLWVGASAASVGVVKATAIAVVKTGISMAGVATGSVVGPRLAMSAFDVAGLVDFGGMGKIWEGKKMAKDWGVAFVTSAVIVGGAKAGVAALRGLSNLNVYRFPGLVKFSRGTLNGVSKFGDKIHPDSFMRGGGGGGGLGHLLAKTGLKKIPNPKAFLAAGAAASSTSEVVKQSFLKTLGLKVVEEGAEEGAEGAAGKIHPGLEMCVSLINAADGVNMKMGLRGIDTANIGISMEAGKLTYNQATPQEFVAKFKSEFKGTQDFHQETSIDTATGIVTLTMGTKVVVDGKTKVVNAATVDIKPAVKSENLSSEVEMAKVKGLSKVDKGGDIYTIDSSANVVPALTSLSNRGFLVINKGNGIYKVSKGETSFKIDIGEKNAAELTNQINQWTDTPMKKSAFVKLLLKFDGDFQKFRAKFPKLAKLLPSSLAKIKIPVPIAGALLSNMAFEMKSPFEMAGIKKFFKPGQMFSVRSPKGVVMTYKVNSVDPSTGKMSLVDTKTKEQLEWNATEALMQVEHYNHEANQAAELSSRLYALGLDDIAVDIGNLQTDVLSNTDTNISTIKARNEVVKKYELMHKKILACAKYLHEQGHTDMASHLTDYRNKAYKSMDERLENAQKAVEYVKNPPKEVVAQPETGPITIDNLTSFANETQLRTKQEYEASLDKALEALKGQQGIVQLNKNIESLIIPDLHARRGELVKILATKGPDGRTNLEKMQAGQLQIVVLGDGMHAEGRAAARWKQAMAGNKESMNMEMTESLGVMKMVMDLKAKNPKMFHYLKGNHDNIDNRNTGGDKEGFRKFAFESSQTTEWVQENYGQEFLQKWAKFEKSLPIMAIGNNFIASHSDPGEGNYNLNDINNRTADAVGGLTWARNPESSMVRKLLVNAGLNPDTAKYIVGHTDAEARYRAYDNGLVRINGHDDMKFAVIPANGNFNPETDVHITKPGKVERISKSDLKPQDKTEYKQLKKEVEKPEAAFKRLKFTNGDEVSVLRTGGKVEKGWAIDYAHPGMQKIRVIKIKGEGVGSVKDILIEDIISHNQKGPKSKGNIDALDTARNIKWFYKAKFKIDSKVNIKRTDGEIETWKINSNPDEHGIVEVRDAAGSTKDIHVKDILQLNSQGPNQQLLVKDYDLAVLETNSEILTPEMRKAVEKGGEVISEGGKTVTIYTRYASQPLGEGGFGSVHEVFYTEGNSTILKKGVGKNPHDSDFARDNFRYEAENAKDIHDINSRNPHPDSNHVIKPIFTSSKVIIYAKISDKAGQSLNLEESVHTMSTKAWLNQFSGGVKGLAYMHRNNLTHNDFKLANIVMGENGGVVIDPGATVHARDIGGRVQLLVDHPGTAPVAHYVNNKGQVHRVSMDYRYSDPALLADSISQNLPLNMNDKYAVGRSIMVMLDAKGHTDNIANAPQEIQDLYNIAQALIDVRNHPFKYYNNNPQNGVDPYYVSIQNLPSLLSQIANTMNY
jgi:hypothetical protein